MKKRVFIAFAIEDEKFRNFLVGQSKHEDSPFEFIDMSVKTPWDNKWKEHCRSRIKGCDGVVVLVSKHTPDATGQLWEIRCAYEEKVPVMLMYVNDAQPTLPPLLKGKQVNVWSWPNLEKFISSL